MIKILIRKLDTKIPLPKYETDGSSGMDLSAYLKNDLVIAPNEKKMIPTGLIAAVPKGYEIQIRPRSGLAAKNSITVLNTPGTIDSDYRGEIKVILFNHGKENFKIENNMRIAQMVVCPVTTAEVCEVDKLDETERGKGGFGSTGK